MKARLNRWLQEEPRAVYLVLGKEPLLVERAVASLVERHGGQGVDRTSVRAAEADATSAITSARTVAMFAPRRLVLVGGIESGTDAALGALAAYAAQPSSGTVLIAYGAGFPAVKKGGKNWSLPLNKAFEAGGAIWKWSDDDAEPVSFVRAAARDLGHELGSAEARLIVDLTGKDLGRLEREVEKLTLLAAPGAAIDAALVHTCCAMVAEPVVWDLTSGIATRRTSVALDALHRLLEDGEAPHKLLALVLWQMRLVLRMAEMVRQGRSDEDIRGELRLRGEVFTALKREMERSFPGAAALLGRIAEANRQMNSSRAGDRRALELLVLELCQRG